MAEGGRTWKGSILSAPNVKREAQFKSGGTSSQDVQRGMQQERDRWVGRLRGLLRDRDQVPSAEIMSLINEVSTSSALESVANLGIVDPEFLALVQRLAAALDSYHRYTPDSRTEVLHEDTDDYAEFIFATPKRSLTILVDTSEVDGVTISVFRVGGSTHVGSVVKWDGEDEPWVQMLRNHIDWLREP